MDTKILNWGKLYDLGELFGAPALEGHEIAVVESGYRGARVNYYPPSGVTHESVQCEQTTTNGKNGGGPHQT